MFCSYQDCKKQPTAFCESCKTNKYFCKDHSQNHIQESFHTMNLIKNPLINQLKFCISQITKDTNDVISSITRASTKTIKLLKSSSQNLKEIQDFIPFIYDKRRISYLINQASLISTAMPESLPENPSEIFNIPKVSILDEGKINLKESKLKSSQDLTKSMKQFLNHVQGKCYLEFNNKTLQEKQRYVTAKLAFVGGERHNDRELLLTPDGRFLFRCI